MVKAKHLHPQSTAVDTVAFDNMQNVVSETERVRLDLKTSWPPDGSVPRWGPPSGHSWISVSSCHCIHFELSIVNAI